ncbi:hypothetical protein NEOLEDRAFT_1169111 [Neolentinus lepideus HHB14362 ss-1]|uniref:Uncharacterized protein n=1 Tax=Neolentinus lepideus HHB14362 ss-1 TaxID=1314782 RepID=A0A165T5D1_9AGAM|nr:hypothetical protein NEOLEDRAFT_1169111 [Neolentinus lepideus HHB14362 ss-1]
MRLQMSKEQRMARLSHRSFQASDMNSGGRVKVNERSVRTDDKDTYSGPTWLEHAPRETPSANLMCRTGSLASELLPTTVKRISSAQMIFRTGHMVLQRVRGWTVGNREKHKLPPSGHAMVVVILDAQVYRGGMKWSTTQKVWGGRHQRQSKTAMQRVGETKETTPRS